MFYSGVPMQTEIDPKECSRSEAFRFWMTAPVPMVTLVKTMNVSRLLKVSGRSSYLDGCMIIGTSAMIQTELDYIINQYTDKFSNPMVMWGKYRKGFFKTTLPVSFQFHHVQMDGGDAARFLEQQQKEIEGLRIPKR